MYIIYCIGVPGRWAKKIGHVLRLENFPRRLSELQCGNPDELQVKFLFKSRSKDHIIHNFLMWNSIPKVRSRSEWYNIGEEKLKSLLISKRPSLEFFGWDKARQCLI